MATIGAGQSLGRREGREEAEYNWCIGLTALQGTFYQEQLGHFLQDCRLELEYISMETLNRKYFIILHNIIQEREKYFDSFIVVISDHHANNIWGNCENILNKTNIIKPKMIFILFLSAFSFYDIWVSQQLIKIQSQRKKI